MRERKRLRQSVDFLLGLFFLFSLSLSSPGCFGSDDEESLAAAIDFFSSIFYFASTRSFPDNDEGDGDIFFTSASGQAGSNTLSNLSDYGTTPGDDDDHVCLLDIPRGRAFFMSRRTDIENTAGDLDIFMVPSLGGTILNLTDQVSAANGSNGHNGDDGEDYCNAVHVPSGDLIFTSNRTWHGQNDADIYRKNLMTDSFGMVTPGALANLTDHASDQSNNGLFEERFELVFGNTLLFRATRTFPDARDIQNACQDPHIFSLDLASFSDSPPFSNLTQQGDEDTCGMTPPISSDSLCGIVPEDSPPGNTVDGFGDPGVVGIEKLVFVSNQDVGDHTGGTQFDIDQDVFVMQTGNANVIYNLTDSSLYDSSDSCSRVISQVPTDGNQIITANDYVAIFHSQRMAAGLRDDQGQWNDKVNATTDEDLFLTDLPLMTPANRIIVLSDLGTDDSQYQGPGVDSHDSLVGVCGTSLIFQSERSDLEANPGNDYDLFLVDVADNAISPLIPLTNNDDSSDDRQDCFLGCDTLLGSAIFVSARSDQGNDHGPSGDTDLFRVRFRDSLFNLKTDAEGTIENLTDSATGDDFDFAGPLAFVSNHCDFSTDILESDVDAFTSTSISPSGMFFGPFQEYSQDDFGFALNINNTLIFTSKRVDPDNVNQDVDIFSQDLPFTPDTMVFRNLINRTDAVSGRTAGESSSDGNHATDDQNDGIEAFINPPGVQLIPISGAI